jgi:glutathione S-transferase
MLPLMLALYTSRLGEAAAPLAPRIQSEIANHLGYMAAHLAGRSFLVGDSLTGADINNVFVLEATASANRLLAYPNLGDYLARMQARPAYQRGLERGGVYALGA